MSPRMQRISKSDEGLFHEKCTPLEVIGSHLAISFNFERFSHFSVQNQQQEKNKKPTIARSVCIV